ncbi:hypothetical protein OHB14_61525 [Streptomyces sp. NBC_01613]
MPNNADELSKRHYRRLVTEVRKLFRYRNFDVLVVAGHSYEVPAFAGLLPARCGKGSSAASPSTASPRHPRTVKEKVRESLTGHAHGELRRDSGPGAGASALQRHRGPVVVRLEYGSSAAASDAAHRSAAADPAPSPAAVGAS